MLAIPDTTNAALVTFEYNSAEVDGVAPGLAWVIVMDNPILAWLVDEAGAEPVAPVIIGSLPAASADTGEVLSPLWAKALEGTAYAPDMWRGNYASLFTFIATNNGAKRKLYAKLETASLAAAFQSWANANPNLTLATPPQ
jgi:hypothetical protein